MASSSSIPQFAWDYEELGDERVALGGLDLPDAAETTIFAEGAEAGGELVDFLMTLHLGGKLSARSLCTIAWWASRAGALGRISDFALRPDDKGTGHPTRTIETATGVRVKDFRKDMFHWPVPGLAKYDLSTSKHSMPLQLPHEAIEQEVLTHPEVLEQAKGNRT